MPLPCPPRLPILLMAGALAACAGSFADQPRTAAAPLASAPATPADLATLAQAQLHEGRFAAAADSFAAARAQGDDAPRTLLGHALALTGSWRQGGAAHMLLSQGDALPTGDRALALALAGEAEIAVRLLVPLVEDSPDNAALRQNLAFAFAMAGRWAEARALVALDLPAGQVPDRMQKWAQIVSAGPTPHRMALMLDTAAPPVPKRRRDVAWRRPHWAGARW